MSSQPIHILNQMGVINSFSVAKKVSEKDIAKFFGQKKFKNKSNKEVEELFKEKVLQDIQDAVLTHKIPGLVRPEELAKQLGMSEHLIKDIPELNNIVVAVSKKLSQKEYNKMSLCFFINSLVNFLGLSEEDFDKFHKNQTDEDGDDNDEDSFSGV